MIKMICVFLTFWCCTTVYADNWLWTEDFSNGLNGWVNQVSGAWYIAGDGKLTYTNISGYGQRNLRFPEQVSLEDGFKIRVDIDYFDVTNVGHFGIMFSSNESMNDSYAFCHSDYTGTMLGRSSWGLNHFTPGTTYCREGGDIATPPTLSRIMEIEFDGSTLDTYIQGQHIQSYSFPDPWGVDVTDGYIGFNIWDSNPSPGYIKINSISYVPEPSTLLLLGLGGLLLRRRKSA